MNRNNLVAILVGLSCGSASATTAIQTAQDNSLSSSFTNAANWTIDGRPSGEAGALLDPAVDYVNPGGKNLCPPRWYDESSPSVFAGRSLTIGSSGGEALLAMYPFANGAHLTFANEGLKLVNGTFCNWYGYNVDIYGKIQIDNCLDEKPIRMYSNGANTQLIFHDPVSSDEGKRLWLYTRDVPEGSTWSQKHFVARFVDGSLAGFRGRVSCYQYAPAYADVRGPNDIMTELVSDTDTIPGTVELGYNCRIGAETAESVVSVGTLAFKENSGFGVTYDKTTKKASLIKVTDAFTHEGRIRVIFDMAQAVMATTPEAYAAADVVPELAIFKAPSGETLDLADFKLEQSVPFPLLDMYVRTDADGLSTLYIKQHGKVVYQKEAETSADYDAGTGLWVSGEHWSDGVVPNPDTQYVSGKDMRTRNKGATAPYVFPGYSLAKLGGQLLMGVVSHEVISNLVFLGSGNIAVWNYWTSNLKISGRLYQYNTSGEGPIFYVYAGRPVEIASDIYGLGCVQLLHTSDATLGKMTLSGNNENFGGRFNFSSKYGSHSETYSVHVHFTDPKNLGGALDTWNYRGIGLSNHATLCPDAEMTLETPNRGIFISGPAYVSNAQDFSVKLRITWNGTWTKRDVGTLGLGGAAPFFKTDGGATPTSGNNVLDITAGSLKPLSADAFQGLQVRFAAGTKLKLDAQPSVTDGGLGQYGMRNTLWATPFELPSGGLDVEIADPADNLSKLRGADRRVAIATVPTARASILRGHLNIDTSAVPKFERVELVEIDNADDTVTFACQLGRQGTLILMR